MHTVLSVLVATALAFDSKDLPNPVYDHNRTLPPATEYKQTKPKQQKKPVKKAPLKHDEYEDDTV